MTQPLLYLRHGQTDGNLQNLCVGQMDLPLNALGTKQAQRAAQSPLLQQITAIISSPLSRAVKTAGHVSHTTGLPVQFHDGLKECGMGVWEGLPEDDPKMYDRWIAGETPDGAESWHMFSSRVRRSVVEIMQFHEHPLIVAHCAVLWAIRDGLGLTTDNELGNGAFATLKIPQGFS
ncbi:MAG: histidine phosphatase family protein [Halocynthiibacter sp.]